MKRVIVPIDNSIGLGNKMFRNAFGYILSKTLNCSFYPENIDFFKNTNIERGSIKGYNNPIFTKQFGNNFCNIDQLLEHNGDVVIDSFLQKQNYYNPYRSILREFFNECIVEQDIDKPTLYIRNGDYRDIGTYLGREYYDNMLERLGYKEINIVTNHADTDVLYLKDKYNSTIISGNIYDDFLYLCRSKELILSQSTFAWWAAFLNDKLKVIYPLLSRDKQKGFWYIDPEVDDIDLYYNSNQNFFYIQ